MIFRKEKYHTIAQKQVEIGLKVGLSTFINTVILPLLFYNDPDKWMDSFSEGTLRTQIISNLIVMSLVTPFLSLVNKYFFHTIWRCRLRRKIYRTEKTQGELNKAYEYPEFDVEENFAHVSLLVLTSIFYFPIFQPGIIIAMLGLLLNYLTQKVIYFREVFIFLQWLLLRRCKISDYKSGSVGRIFIRLVSNSPFLLFVN